MTETNPNYVPVDWTDNESRIVGAKPSYDSPSDAEKAAEAFNGRGPWPGETATLNSAGDPIKVGDRVHHIADVNQSRRSVGVVTYVGPVTVLGSSVDNGARCRWDGGEKEESHHVDQLTVLL